MFVAKLPAAELKASGTRPGSILPSTAPAVKAGGRTHSYREINRIADELADRLFQSGIGSGALVGLCLHRTPERLAAMLAIWKAGAAVLALDPAWPAERLRAIVADSGAALVLSEDRARLLPDVAQMEIGAVDWLAAGQNHTASALSPAARPPEALAYVVYTSGSTGVPKGAEISHANLDNLVQWHNAAFEITDKDRVSHVAGLGFDAAFWEVWPALCAGAMVVLPDDDTRTSPERLQRWLLDERITCAFVPTVLAEILFRLDWPADTALRIMLTGGEALHTRPPPGLPFKVVNNYGPSECTVVATSGVVAPFDDGGVPTIGRPITGVQIHLLGPHGTPVPDGEPGEIAIGGAGVGRGYRNAAQLTAQSFAADRFNPEPGSRLYYTGDIGRRLANGDIAFLGRTDSQQKIRGMRVEPAEVACALGQHPDIEWCTVLGVNSARGRELNAYLLLWPGASPDAESLRAFLQRTLPDWMIPSNFLQIQTVPLTSSGKLDIDRLVLPDCATPLARAGFRAPSSPVEIRLASIMGALLGGLQVGLDDNFFFLGGHSLLGTQAVVRIRESFGIQLALRDLFSAPTVGQLAVIVTRLLTEALDSMTDEQVEMWLAN